MNKILCLALALSAAATASPALAYVQQGAPSNSTILVPANKSVVAQTTYKQVPVTTYTNTNYTVTGNWQLTATHTLPLATAVNVPTVASTGAVTYLSDRGNGNAHTVLEGSKIRAVFKADHAIASVARKADKPVGGSIGPVTVPGSLALADVLGTWTSGHTTVTLVQDGASNNVRATLAFDGYNPVTTDSTAFSPTLSWNLPVLGTATMQFASAKSMTVSLLRQSYSFTK